MIEFATLEWRDIGPTGLKASVKIGEYIIDLFDTQSPRDDQNDKGFYMYLDTVGKYSTSSCAESVERAENVDLLTAMALFYQWQEKYA